VHEVPPGGVRLLEIGADWRDEASQAALQDAEAILDLSAELPPGEHDLGDIVLAPPGSDAVVRRLDDPALEARYRDALRFRDANGRYQRLVETCLLEMARRGGGRWVAFLRAELTRIRSGDDPRRTLFEEDLDLEYLTVLRRAEGRPDPLAIRIEGTTHEGTYPDVPVLVCKATNVDRKPFTITEGGSYRSGRFARIRVEAIAPDERLLPPTPSPFSFGGGMSRSRTLRPGGSVRFDVPIGYYVVFPGPGEYRVRIQYHDQRNIDSDPSGEGWIVSTSPTVTVRMKARPLKLTHRRLDEMAAWIDEIDTSRPVPIVDEPWRPGMAFPEGEPAAPEDRLFRAGWDAVPALLRKLDDETSDPRRRAWILAMLWNLTGLHPPAADEHLGAVGSCLLLQRWPSSAGGEGSEKPYGVRAGPTVPESQKKLVDLWRASAAWFDVEIVD
jgi:hypothetical protein